MDTVESRHTRDLTYFTGWASEAFQALTMGTRSHGRTPGSIPARINMTVRSKNTQGVRRIENSTAERITGSTGIKASIIYGNVSHMKNAGDIDGTTDALLHSHCFNAKICLGGENQIVIFKPGNGWSRKAHCLAMETNIHTRINFHRMTGAQNGHINWKQKITLRERKLKA